MFEIIIAIIAAILQAIGKSDDAAADSAAEAVGDGGWISSVWDTTKDVFSAVGQGLSEVELSDEDVIRFSLQKEAGLYAPLGIGDDGVVQDVSGSLRGLVDAPWKLGLWILGGAWLVTR